MRKILGSRVGAFAASGEHRSVVGAFVLLALLSGGLAWYLGFGDTADTESGRAPPPLQVPLLSARRIPDVVVHGAGTHRLDEQLDAVMATSPSRSCLAVQPGGVGPVQARGTGAGLVPASLIKLLVVHAAIETFGPDHRFSTQVMADGAPTDGSVDDLYLVGGGDPFLGNDSWERRGNRPRSLSSHTRIEELADRVVEAGITRVNGSVIGDSSLFSVEVEKTGDPETDRDLERLGPVTALTVNGGFLDWPDQPGGRLSQSVPASDPTVQGAQVLIDLLTERGVDVIGRAGSGATPVGATEVAAIESSTVEELSRTVNTYSSSFGAQMLAKHLGLEVVGDGSVAGGARALTQILGELGLPMAGVSLVDGTGLAIGNRVTCRLVIEVLIEAGPTSTLAESLAIAGVRGTVDERFANAELRDLVRAKTGTLRSSRALAGFARSWVDGAETPFVIIMNEIGLTYEEFDPWSRTIQEDFLIALVQFPCVPDRSALDWPDFDVREGSIADGAERQGDAFTETASSDGRGEAGRETGRQDEPPPVDVDPLRIRIGDPLASGCTDGQRIHDVRIDGYLIEVRYSPSCDALWGRATFSAIASGAAELHLVGYSCLDAETDCRWLASSAPIVTSQDCVNVPDEAGTCLLANDEQVWTEVLPASVPNVRACLGLTPSFGNQDPADLDLDGCTPPAFERQPDSVNERQLARTRTACRQPRTVAPRPVAAPATDG